MVINVYEKNDTMCTHNLSFRWRVKLGKYKKENACIYNSPPSMNCVNNIDRLLRANKGKPYMPQQKGRVGSYNIYGIN